MPKPYVGITGIMHRMEADVLLAARLATASHKIMLGQLASEKTLFLREANKWPNRYPAPETISANFPDHPQALNLIHYNTKQVRGLSLYRELYEAATWYGGPHLHGFQLNIAWPAPLQLEAYKKSFPNGVIVLQIGGKALEMIGEAPENSPAQTMYAAKKLAGMVKMAYDHLVDYVLLDPSGGYGKPFDPERARVFLAKLKSHDVQPGLGVAGGLGPDTLRLLEPLVEEFPDLSCDAEGRLRTPMPEDQLNLERAKAYDAGVLAMFAKRKEA